MANPLLQEIDSLLKNPSSPPLNSAEWNKALRIMKALALVGPGVRGYTGLGTLVQGGAGEGDGSGGRALKYPWQPYDFTGRKFKIRPGVILGPDGKAGVASNPGIEIEAPANKPAGYLAWVKIGLALVAGSITVTSRLYEHGEAFPAGPAGNPTTGAPPTFVYLPLCAVYTTADAIDYYDSFVRSSVQVGVETIGSCGLQTQQIKFASIGLV